MRTLLLVIVIGLISCTAQSATIETDAGCENARIAEMLARFDTVEIAAAAGAGIPGDRAGAYRKMEESVALCARRGASVTIRPITEHAIAELPILDEIVPDKTGENAYNNLHYLSDRNGYKDRVRAALDTLPSIGKSDHGADPLGALATAARSLRGESKPIIVLISNGWQQTHDLNVLAFNKDPARYAPGALQILKLHHTLPKLTGVRVVLAGRTTAVPWMHVTDTQVDGLCEFWKAIVVDAAHGTMQPGDCTESLPGITR